MVSLILLLVVYQNTSGTVTWVYMAETTTDTGLGASIMMLLIAMLSLSILTPILMTPYGQGGIGPTNVFWMLALINIFSTLYAHCFIKDCQGMSEKAKKEIYTPAKYLSE